MLDDVLPWLACPHCGGNLRVGGASLICSSGHTMNIARQGYVSLLGRDSGTHTADSADLVAARDRVFSTGLFDPLRKAVAEIAASLGPELPDGPVLDLGSGPGSYLGAVLDALPDRAGIALDNSKFAARRAARCHPRAGAIVADIWDRIPVQDNSVALILNLFAPRNGEEMARVLGPGGRWIVVVPQPGHLAELAEPFGMISVDPAKEERLEQSLKPLGEPLRNTDLGWEMVASREQVADLVGMGPSAGRMSAEETAEALKRLPETIRVTGSVRIGVG